MDDKEKVTPEKRVSWIEIPEDSDFSIYNIPFGVFRTLHLTPRCCTAIGPYVVDLTVLAEHGYFGKIPVSAFIFHKNQLNHFIDLGKDITNRVRERLMELFTKDSSELENDKDLHSHVFYKHEVVTMMMPVHVGDYTDFYSSIEHATNVGAMFRDPSNALLPNWKHLPIAYHGRASSIVVSGTPLIRPKGQFKKNKEDFAPIFGPTQALDYELEIGFVIGKNSKLGEAIPASKTEEYIFGFLLFNDWSARDIQSWEYVPLGPFLAKNFMSSVSPWIVTTEALAPFKTQGPMQDEVLPYLATAGSCNYDIHLEVSIQPEGGHAERIGRSNFKYIYWNTQQQLAHHTVNGCNVAVGDIMASGTISGPVRESAGCMLELTRQGREPITLQDGSQRKYILDGDTIIMKGFSVHNDVRIGFGQVSGKVYAAL